MYSDSSYDIDSAITLLPVWVFQFAHRGLYDVHPCDLKPCFTFNSFLGAAHGSNSSVRSSVCVRVSATLN